MHASHDMITHPLDHHGLELLRGKNDSNKFGATVHAMATTILMAGACCAQNKCESTAETDT